MMPLNQKALFHSADALRDCAFLSFILFLSFVLYIGGLGFYSDDWHFLSTLSHAGNASLSDSFQALYADENVRQRPMQALHLAWMYQLFGANPFGYHLTNAGVFITAVLLFYLVLRELRLPRLVVLTIPLVFGLLPHYSTDRFWIAAFQANLSIALYFASLYSDLRAHRTVGTRGWSWKLLSLACLLGSALAYEVALPLYILNVVVVWLHAQRSHIQERWDWRKQAYIAAMVGSNLVVLSFAVYYKAAATVRAGGLGTSYASHLLDVIKRAAIIDYIGIGVLLPHVAVKVLSHHTEPIMLVVGASLGTIVFAYLYRVASQPRENIQDARVWLTVLALSPVVYFLGYAVFITTSQFMVHKTGISNRIAIAGAIGVAMTFTGLAGATSSLMPSMPLRRSVFPAMITFLSLCGFLIINANAKFWIIAYEEQRRVLDDIRTNVASPPAGSTLILLGVCPYTGSGIVFEGYWDLGGALQVVYQNPALGADVVTPKLKVGEDGLTTWMYGSARHYQYGDSLLLYDVVTKAVHKLVDAESTRHYFDNFKLEHAIGCPQGSEGEGVAPF